MRRAWLSRFTLRSDPPQGRVPRPVQDLPGCNQRRHLRMSKAAKGDGDAPASGSRASFGAERTSHPQPEGRRW
jgi:hypothetical protein